ncbi:hypothetical protein FB45DRAFT_939461 [Roridomyces roridus]|uniref:C2 domain-containing protein n=1 Tax=Roridomyces roridus TaxID=1738132 RepID=A0AAD7FAN9_9AGAR|nr:hypothetical protein FB45DRAFT_939461 [Roridomyces roridus]
MPRILHIHSICVTSTVKEHPDLPGGMKMFAGLIVNNVMVQKTVAVEQEQTGTSPTWKMEFDCNIPSDVTKFHITILREAQGVRLIGFAEIAQDPDEGLAFGEEQQLFQLPLTKVNMDGPLLTLAVEFNSIAGVEFSGKNDLAIQIGPSDGQIVPMFWRQQMRELNTSQDFQDLWMLHKMILLLLPTMAYKWVNRSSEPRSVSL